MIRNLSIALALLLTGCAYSSFTPNYDQQFGDSVRAARSAQILNPSAGTQPPVMGLEGTSAHEALTRYNESFKSPPPVVNVINIGGQVGGGSGGSGR